MSRPNPVPLMLVPVVEKLNFQPAAFYEGAAADYLGMGRTKFHELVTTGVLPFITHVNGVIRVFLRADLDAYIESRKRCIMKERKVSLVALPSKVSSDEF